MTITINLGTIFVIFLNLINSKIIECATEVLTDHLQQILNISNNSINLLPVISTESYAINNSMDNIDIERRNDNNKTDYIYQKNQQLVLSNNNQKENLLSIMPISKFYINYKKTYGIRYDPTKIKRNFKIENDFDDTNDNLEELPVNYHNEMAYNNFSNEHNSDMTTEIMKPLSDFETTTIFNNYDFNSNELSVESNELESSINLLSDHINYVNATTTVHSIIIDNDAQFVSTIKPKSDSITITNIMKPSRVQMAIDFLKNRFKQFFQFRRYNTLIQPSNEKRFLNVFSLIKFQNIPCATSNSLMTKLNGTCYNKVECNQLGGVVVAKCAEGFGVCCIFQFGCGGTNKQDISYFKSPNYPAASTDRLMCTFTVEILPNVKQILLEFLFFELKPPIDGSCIDDQFIVYGQNLNFPVPIICGINTGQHIYVDVENSIENKIFLSVLTTTPGARGFNIRISQLTKNLAPQSCLQYYTGIANYIQTFNYENQAKIVETRKPSYFNNLNYAICIKRAPGHCTVTYTNIIDQLELPFQLLNVDEEGINVIASGQAGAEIYNCGDDFIYINGIRLCGDRFNDAGITEDFTVNAPVIDYSAGPILLPVRTNDAVVGRGFKLFYTQQPCQS